MITLCTQLMEAIHYLHDDVKVLHNDLKANNVLVCTEITTPSTEKGVQIIIIDFGKATSIENAKYTTDLMT